MSALLSLFCPRAFLLKVCVPEEKRTASHFLSFGHLESLFCASTACHVAAFDMVCRSFDSTRMSHSLCTVRPSNLESDFSSNVRLFLYVYCCSVCFIHHLFPMIESSLSRLSLTALDHKTRTRIRQRALKSSENPPVPALRVRDCVVCKVKHRTTHQAFPFGSFPPLPTPHKIALAAGVTRNLNTFNHVSIGQHPHISCPLPK